MSKNFSFYRFYSIAKKEIILLKRDPIALFILITIPVIELIFFGSIIKTEVKNIPTIIVTHDHSAFTNSLIAGFQNTEYFKVIKVVEERKKSDDELLKSEKVKFIITIPEHFAKDLIRKRHPHILLEGDGTNPMVIGAPFNAISMLARDILNRDLKGPLATLKSPDPLFYVDKHPVYNPNLVDQYHTLPGLITTILTIVLSTLMVLSIVNEYVKGTLEMLLLTSVKPLEVIFGKLVPNLILGYFLLLITLFWSCWLFGIPFIGSLPLLLFCAFIFMIATLAVGGVVSTMAKSEYEALVFLNLYTLPSILLSGFLFPFFSMPVWAQYLGNMLPPAHFLRIISAIMIRGAGFRDVLLDLSAIALFSVVIILICFKYYRKTLD